MSLLIQSDIPICAERTLYWGSGPGSAKFGTAVNVGATAPTAQWSFAYASNGNGDQAYISAMNPTPLPAHVRFTLYTAGGTVGSEITATVEPQSRATVPLTGTGTVGGQFAVVSSSDVPIVCEESLYFGGSPNSGDHSGSVVQGAMQGETQWTFPGLPATLFSSGTWYVLNTGLSDAHLTAMVMNADDQPSQVHFHAVAGKLTSIALDSMQDLFANSPSIWSSDAPVIISLVARGDHADFTTVVPAFAVPG